VLAEMISASSDIVLLQETKLPDVPLHKRLSFLPRRLDEITFIPSIGAVGGIITAWNGSVLRSSSTYTTPHTLSTAFTSTSSSLAFTITNIYAPASPKGRPDFLDELRSIPSDPNIPWMIIDDFNMIRYPEEKNNSNFRASEAAAFNDYINTECLIELPLLDRSYTWSNQRVEPTLERIDRAFINTTWDASMPNTTLSSLTRRTSDHVPLVDNISTHIPKSNIFRFDNYWINFPGFQDTVANAWSCRVMNREPSAAIAAKLKETRRCLKKWKSSHANVYQQDTDCKIVINLLDLVEEHRVLNAPELRLRAVITSVLSRCTQARLLIWKQRAKIRAAIDGDENTRYFHACANHRRRKNNIQVLEHNNSELHEHEQKAMVLHDFYLDLLGTNINTTWDFSLSDLYPNERSLGCLDAPFSHDEIYRAIRSMHSAAQP